MILFGCSGPGAAEAIATSELVGLSGLAVTLLLAIAVALAGRSRRRWLAFLGVVLHPGWWMSARSGDCGYMLRYASVGLTVVFAGIAAWMIWRTRSAAPAS